MALKYVIIQYKHSHWNRLSTVIILSPWLSLWFSISLLLLSSFKEEHFYALNYHAHLWLWFSNALRCRNRNFGDFERVWVRLITPVGPAWHTVMETPGPPSYLINMKPCNIPTAASAPTTYSSMGIGSHWTHQSARLLLKSPWHLARRACFSIDINICSVENFKRGPVLVIYRSSLPKQHQLLPTLAKLLMPQQGSLLITWNHGTKHTHVNVNKDLLWITSSEA